jgi:hypothetical protein
LVGDVSIVLWVVLCAGPALAQPPQDAGVEDAGVPVAPPVDPAADPTLPAETPPAEVPPPVEETPITTEAPPTEEPAAPPAEQPPPVEPTPAPEEPEEGFFYRIDARYFARMNVLSEIPLAPLPRTDPADTGDLGQNVFAEQRLRVGGEIGWKPEFRLVGEMDLLNGVAFGELAQGIGTANYRRDEYGYPGARFRELFIEWRPEIFLLRAGQMTSSWGLGIVANDGDTPSPFGDPRYGDVVRRILLGTKPLGEDSPFLVAAAADWIVDDVIADVDRDDVAFQGVLSALYADQETRLGAYLVARTQENALEDTLTAFVIDLYGRRSFAVESATYYVAAEGALVLGSTTYARTPARESQDVRQLLGALELGRTTGDFDLVLETGYASGDSNTEDDTQLRGTFDPDHRVGLIMFPEVLGAASARASHLARAPELAGRPSRGSELLPTNGGVAGAFYMFAYSKWRPLEWLEGRLGALFGVATSDVIDPFAQRALSQNQNYLGGDPSYRDLGFEVDAAILGTHELVRDLTLTWGVEGGIFLPGAAFERADETRMDPVGMVRARLGIAYDGPTE